MGSSSKSSVKTPGSVQSALKASLCLISRHRRSCPCIVCFLQSLFDKQHFQLHFSALLAVGIITTELVTQTKRRPSFLFVIPSVNSMHKIMVNQAQRVAEPITK